MLRLLDRWPRGGGWPEEHARELGARTIIATRSWHFDLSIKAAAWSVRQRPDGTDVTYADGVVAINPAEPEGAKANRIRLASAQQNRAQVLPGRRVGAEESGSEGRAVLRPSAGFAASPSVERGAQVCKATSRDRTHLAGARS